MAVIFFALGFSTKWLVIYSAVGMLVLLAALRFRDIRKLKIGWGAKYAAFFDHPFLLLMGFIAVAVGIYFLTYIPDMLIGRPLLGANGNGVIDLQFAMYSYHANLVATHAFASPWWSWPFMVNPTPGAYVPLWLAISYLPNNIHSTISVFGNPAVWWVGFASVIAISLEVAGIDDLSSRLWAKIRKKPTVPNREYTDEGEGENPTNGASHHGNTKTIAVGFLIFVLTAIISEIINYHTFLLAVPLYAGMFLAVYGMVSNLEGKHSLKGIAPIFIVSVFFFSWLPYTFISRVTFIYHFYVSMPFLCLGSAYFISKYWSTRKGKVAAVALFASVIVLFGVFYPVISGAPTPVSYLDHLKWFGSWYF